MKQTKYFNVKDIKNNTMIYDLADYHITMVYIRCEDNVKHYYMETTSLGEIEIDKATYIKIHNFLLGIEV